MVVSLTGTVDSVPVIFERKENDLWETVVPPDLTDGRYIVELIATDDAGNQTYQIAELWVWQKVITHFQMIEQPFTHKLLTEKYSEQIRNGFHAEIMDFRITHTDRGDKFCIRIS